MEQHGRKDIQRRMIKDMSTEEVEKETFNDGRISLKKFLFVKSNSNLLFHIFQENLDYGIIFIYILKKDE